MTLPARLEQMTASMTRVSSDEFYARVGPLNVHPTIVSDWSNEYGYVLEWRMLTTRELVGVTFCPPSGESGYYLVATPAPYRWRVGDVFARGEARWRVDDVHGDRAVLRSLGATWATTTPLTFEEWNDDGKWILESRS